MDQTVDQEAPEPQQPSLPPATALEGLKEHLNLRGQFHWGNKSGTRGGTILAWEEPAPTLACAAPWLDHAQDLRALSERQRPK